MLSAERFRNRSPLFRTGTPRISENLSENTFVSPQHVLQADSTTPVTPVPVFRRPFILSLWSTIPDSQALTLSPYISLTPSLLHLPPPLPLPPKPLYHDRPEIIYQQYITEKESWLAKNPSVQANQYQKAQGWQIYSKRIIEDYRIHLGLDRYKPSGEYIRGYHPNWTVEEITAWIDYQEVLEDRLTAEFEAINKAGQRVPDKKAFFQAIEEREEEDRQLFTM